MKKFLLISFAALLVAVFTLPAAAVEHEFGGYWRTRFFMNRDFSGSDAGANDEALDFSVVDTRTRLYYTALLNDNLKFVNKFEFDADWGDGGGEYGDVGTDAVGVEIKNSYADFNLGPARVKMGAHDAKIARGFLFDADFAGVTLNFDLDTIQVPLYWIRIDEGGIGKDANDGDADMIGVAPFFSFGEVKINPMLFWLTSEDASLGDELGDDLNNANTEKVNLYYLGVNADAAFGPANVWFTGIYQGGTAEARVGDDIDYAAYLVAVGGGASFGMFEAHGEVFYATGDDDAGDDEADNFFVPAGQSYYWAEIMGFGTFDDQASNGAPADQISDILAIGIGGSVTPMEKLTLGIDIWYAQLAEDDANGDQDLGTEIDFTAKYALMEDLDLKVVAAYLLAGDATDPTDDNDDTVNPFELGAQISLSF